MPDQRPPSKTKLVLFGMLGVVLGLAVVVYLFTVLLVGLHG